MSKARVQIKVKGQVQGVFFRSTCQELAFNLQLTGYVQNLPDGAVLVVAEGEKEKLAKLLNWCKKGPNFARVEEVKVSWEKAKGAFEGFEIRY